MTNHKRRRTVLVLAVLSFLTFENSTVQAAGNQKEKHSVSGLITFDETPKSDGKVYIIIAPEGGADLFAALPKKPEDGNSFNNHMSFPDRKIIKLDEAPGKENKFSVNLPDGKYTATCFVKYSSSSVCNEITVNNEKAIGNCFPMANDLMCLNNSSFSVEGQNVSGVSLVVGKNEERNGK